MENKHVLIVEHNPNKLNIINESAGPISNKKLTVGGIFTEFDVQNRNKRFYKAENFVPCMNALLAQKEMLGVLYGELDHPEGFDISAERASHVIENLVYNKEANRIDGSISILTTPKGQIIRNILEDGYPVFVSSRAAGVTHPGNVIELKELYTYDAVLNPGFASTRQTVLNESFGLGSPEETYYRIYEMSNSLDVETLTRDNKNDYKTLQDLKYMENNISLDIAALEAKIIESVKNKVSNEEVIKLQEAYDTAMAEIEKLNNYISFFKKNYNVLVKETKKIKEELNENTVYYNHVSEGLNNVQENIINVTSEINYLKEETEIITAFAESIATEAEKEINEVKSEINITQKFVEHVATEAKNELDITQKFVEHVATEAKNELDITQKFVEHVATEATNEFNTTNKFAEYIAEHLDKNNKFTEYAAKEIEITQGLLESVAKSYKEDSYFIAYIADKVEGTINYVGEAVEKLKTSTPVNESVETSIHDMENIGTFLGIDQEEELVNTISNNIDDITLENLGTLEDEDIDALFGNSEETETETDEETDELEGTEDVDGVELEDNELEGSEDFDATTDMLPEVEPETSLETSLLSALVNILGSDETGIVMEITPENKLIIQKSGTDETVELDETEIEVLDNNEDLVESVANVLMKAKQAKIAANKQPHFFHFLNESERLNFKLLDIALQEKIMERMENSTYFTESDVLNIIGNVISEDTRSYEERIISAIPENIKESWNALSQEAKEGFIAESKFFKLTTTADINAYWNTRTFARNAQLGYEVITETLKSDDDEFSEEYIAAFKRAAGVK